MTKTGNKFKILSGFVLALMLIGSIPARADSSIDAAKGQEIMEASGMKQDGTENRVNLDAAYGDNWFGKLGARIAGNLAWLAAQSNNYLNPVGWVHKAITGKDLVDADEWEKKGELGAVYFDVYTNSDNYKNGYDAKSLNKWIEDNVKVEATRWVGPNGETYVAVDNARDNTVIIEGGYNSGAFKGCEFLPVKLYKQRKCFFCPLFAVVYRAADNMAIVSMTKLAVSFATIIALGMAIWVAFQTLTHVSSLTKQDGPKFLGNLIKQSFKFVIAFILLTHTNEIYDYVIIPLLSSGLTFGKNLMMLPENLFMGAQNEVTKETVMATVYYTPELYKQLEGFISAVQQQIGFMQAIGSSLMCIGNHLMIGKDGVGFKNFGDGFQMFIQGIVMAGFGFLLALAFAFYLVDAVVQLGIVGALMPFLIACWPFKLTSSYANKGFSMFLNSVFVFVFMGLVISVNIQLIDSALSQTSMEGDTGNIIRTVEDQEKFRKQCEGTEDRDSEVCAALAQVNAGAMYEIFDAINSQRMESEGDKKGLKDLTDISGTGFLILIFCCIFGFKLTNQVSSLAGTFGGGGMKGIAPSIATMGASATLSAGKKLTQPTREAIADSASDAGEKLWGGVKSAPKRLFNFFSNRGKSGGVPAPAASRRQQPNPATPNPGPTAPVAGGEGAAAQNSRNAATLASQSKQDKDKTNPKANVQTTAKKGDKDSSDEHTVENELPANNTLPENTAENEAKGQPEAQAEAHRPDENRGSDSESRISRKVQSLNERQANTYQRELERLREKGLNEVEATAQAVQKVAKEDAYLEKTKQAEPAPRSNNRKPARTSGGNRNRTVKNLQDLKNSRKLK